MVFRDFWLRPKVKALDRVDLQVNTGEIFGLLGPNGSGKSTLVKILLGLLFPTSGRAAVFGRDPRNIAVKDRIGYMPEESYLYPYLNAEETLDFYGRLFNLPRTERRHRVQLLLEMVGLERQRTRPLVEYSKGMARRIGLAQALINDPDLVFLDEPTTGLDPIGTREIKDLIIELKRRGKTVFLCSHLLADVEDVCDRVAILYGGKVRRVGDIAELLKVKAQTQITAGALGEETVRRVLSTIEEMEGAEMTVQVDSPRDRLESFFLRVVEEAQSAHVETSGTTAGTGAETFFAAIEREEKADTILKELLMSPTERRAAAEEQRAAGATPEPEPVVLAASKHEPDARESVLKNLVVRSGEEAGAGASAAAEERAEAEGPVVLRAGEGQEETGPSTEEVLGKLLKQDKKAAKDDDASSGEAEA